MKILLLGMKPDQYRFLLNGLEPDGHRIQCAQLSQSDAQVRDMIKRVDFVLTTRFIKHKYQHTARSLRVPIHTCMGGISQMRELLLVLLRQNTNKIAA